MAQGDGGEMIGPNVSVLMMGTNNSRVWRLRRRSDMVVLLSTRMSDLATVEYKIIVLLLSCLRVIVCFPPPPP